MCPDGWFEISAVKNDPRTQTESFKPDWLTLKDQCLQKARWIAIHGYIKV